MSNNFSGSINTPSFSTKFVKPTSKEYDDTELRELIEKNKKAIENFEEVDPTMLAISNTEIERLFNKWED